MGQSAAVEPVRVVERVGDWRAAEVVIDREAGIVRNVALAGPESKNGYRYTDEALRRAVPLYADRPVFLDHGANATKPQERSTRDLAGTIVNPRFAEGRIRGDIQTLGTEAGRTFLALAESGSGTIGMSHVVLVTQNRERTLVEEIHDVVSVDAVTFPATTSSLAEQTAGGADAIPPLGSWESIVRQIDAQLPRLVREITGDADACGERLGVFPRDVLVRLVDEDERYCVRWTVRDGRLRLSDRWELADEAAVLSEQWDEWFDRGAAADDGEESPAVLRQRLREMEAERQALLAELAELRCERDAAARAEAVGLLLESSLLPAEAVSETFRRQLLAADDAERAALMADRLELYERLQRRAPRSESRGDGGENEAAAEAELVRLLRRQ